MFVFVDEMSTHRDQQSAFTWLTEWNKRYKEEGGQEEVFFSFFVGGIDGSLTLLGWKDSQRNMNSRWTSPALSQPAYEPAREACGSQRTQKKGLGKAWRQPVNSGLIYRSPAQAKSNKSLHYRPFLNAAEACLQKNGVERERREP